jgi:hypothetical protein
MRTLSSTLLAAQRKADRLPYVEAKVYDYEAGIKRLTWTRLYTGSEPDNHHGIAFDGQGAMHRIRADGNSLYHQKIASPFTDPAPFPLTFPISLVTWFDSWELIAEDCEGPCAIAAYGARVYIFYRKTDNTLRKYYSHNYGDSWTSAQLVAYADVLSMAACWWGTGDIVVCFALKASQVNGIVLDSSDQSTDGNTWSDATHPLLNTYGIGATYNAFWPGIEVVLAGKEDDDPYDHFDLFRTIFTDTYNFLALESFLMAPDGEDSTCEYPDCHLPASAQDYETNRIIAVEKFAGVTAYTRPFACHMVKGTYWSDTTFTEPRPFLDITPAYGLRLQSTADYWWLEKPDGVWTAPRATAQALDLTGDLIGMTLCDPVHLQLELDNSKGQYSTPGSGSLASLRFRSEVVVGLGYKTSQGSEASEAGTYWIDAWEHRSLQPNQSTFIIVAISPWSLAERWTARYQMRWNKDAVNPKNVWQIIYQVLARVGIKLTNTPPQPQSSAIINLYPDFTINPGTHGGTALRKLLSFVPDGLLFRGQLAYTKNPLASESSCYSYGTDHRILTGKYSVSVPVSHARAIGRDASDDRILEEALDWDLLQLGIDNLEQDYDPNLQTAARARERADAILRTRSLDARYAQITVPTNVGQEFLDVVTVTDKRTGVSGQKYRVRLITIHYDRRKGRYEQTLTLCAP